MSAENVRVRFAPSPTGHLHIGGARTAIYNWAFARHHGGAFILRIDDTDRERSTERNTAAILRALEWLGLDWDEGPGVGGGFGPYIQTERTASHLDALSVLRSAGHAYPCFCSAEDLDAKRDAARARKGFSGYDRTCRALPLEEALARADGGEPHVWRVKVPDARGDITMDDEIRGRVAWPADAMDDLVLVRTDGTPTYNFATVVDDWRMRISHVIRGDDHLSNTPRQIIIYEALGAPVPAFGHMSLICGADGKRLSKRHGATSVEAYRDEGYLPEALLNYLALLGWSIDDKTTIFDRETLVREFDLARVSKNPGIWDPDKLEWMNGHYIRGLSPAGFVDRIVPLLVEAGLITADEAHVRRAWLETLAPLVAERIKRMDEVVPMTAFLFSEDVAIEPASGEKALRAEGVDEALRQTRVLLADLDPFDHGVIEAGLRSLPEALVMKPRTLFQAVRVAVTGGTVSPPLFESIELLGRERTLRRLDAAREWLAAPRPFDTPPDRG